MIEIDLMNLRFSEIVNHFPGFFAILTLDSKFSLLNETGAKWTGFTSSEAMQGLSYGDVRCKAAEHADIFLSQDKLLLTTGKLKFLGYYSYAGDDWKIILGQKYILKNVQGDVIGIVSQFNDFTDSNLIDISRFLINSSRYVHQKKQFIYEIDSSYPKINLSDRQAEILFFLLRGKTSKEIAKLLLLSPRTIETHIEEIKKKIKCTNKSELIEKAIANGFMNIIPKGILTSFESYRRKTRIA